MIHGLLCTIFSFFLCQNLASAQAFHNGDLIIESALKVISGKIEDIILMLPSVVINDTTAIEYWICPKTR